MAKKKSVRTTKRKTSWEEAMNEFLYLKRAQGLAPRTILDYRNNISLLFRRYPDTWPDKVRDGVLQHMSDDIKPGTFNIRRKYLKVFFEWCIEEQLLQENPLRGISSKKDQGRIVNLHPDILKQLISLPDKKTFSGVRDYALLLLTLDTGIRPGEAFSLLIGDINFQSGEVYVRDSIAKTRVARTLPVSIVTLKAIRLLIDTRHPDWKDSTPVICTYEGQSFTCHRWGDRLRMYCKRLKDTDTIISHTT